MDRRTLAAVALITGAGLLLRLLAFSQSLFGDELSTLYLVDGKSLGQVVSGVSSDAEISPPLYFVLAWLATRFGESPELVRLPALLAGTALIPLTFMLGLRAAGRNAGLLAAAFVALAPFMIVFSATGRAYSLLLLFLAGGALCLLKASERGGWWWAGWALCAAGAMYSHYTAVFVLAAQFAWALWAAPKAREVLLAAAGAVILYLPWLGPLRADLDSPTNDLLQALQGSGLGAKRDAVAQWGVGHPLIPPDWLPGAIVGAAMLAAILLALGLVLFGHRARRADFAAWCRRNRAMVLVGLAAISTPLAEAALALAGTDLFGSRNLTASWPFAAITVAFLVTRSGRVAAIATGCVLLLGFGYGAIRTLTAYPMPDYQAVGRQIESEARPGDSVVDLLSPYLTPVPLTPLDAAWQVPEGIQVFDLNQPLGEPPFLPSSPKVDPDQLLDEAFRRSRDGSVFVLGPTAEAIPGRRAHSQGWNVELPPGWRVASSQSFPGLVDLNLYRVSR